MGSFTRKWRPKQVTRAGGFYISWATINLWRIDKTKGFGLVAVSGKCCLYSLVGPNFLVPGVKDVPFLLVQGWYLSHGRLLGERAGYRRSEWPSFFCWFVGGQHEVRCFGVLYLEPIRGQWAICCCLGDWRRSRWWQLFQPAALAKTTWSKVPLSCDGHTLWARSTLLFEVPVIRGCLLL